MNITSPKEMGSGLAKLEEAVEMFEKQLKREDKDENYYHVVISDDFNREVYDEVEKLYLKAGWRVAKCSTSSEKNERGGLTGLVLER